VYIPGKDGKCETHERGCPKRGGLLLHLSYTNKTIKRLLPITIKIRNYLMVIPKNKTNEKEETK